MVLFENHRYFLLGDNREIKPLATFYEYPFSMSLSNLGVRKSALGLSETRPLHILRLTRCRRSLNLSISTSGICLALIHQFSLLLSPQIVNSCHYLAWQFENCTPLARLAYQIGILQDVLWKFDRILSSCPLLGITLVPL